MRHFVSLSLFSCKANPPLPPPPAPDRHWDPATSQEGDGHSSGPNDPGLAQLGKDPYAADENNGKKSAAPRSASIAELVGFALPCLAAVLVAVL